jgi:polar amino acid transport system ATP-binding protein
MSAILRIENLQLSRGERPILRGVHFEARRGELVALMGLSGGGKTTVLRAIAALERFDAGSIYLDGVMLKAGPVPTGREAVLLRKRVGMVFQLHYLFEHLTALDNVTLAPVHVLHKPRAESERAAVSLLDLMGVAARKDAYPRQLSGGEAQRVAIARAMAMDPPLLLMDEPTASLDPARRGELGATLQRLCGDGRTLLVTTHDDDFARDWATRVVILAEGEVVEEGDPKEVLTSPKHAATRALLRKTEE